MLPYIQQLMGQSGMPLPQQPAAPPAAAPQEDGGGSSGGTGLIDGFNDGWETIKKTLTGWFS
jgi:hypothetical protein